METIERFSSSSFTLTSRFGFDPRLAVLLYTKQIVHIHESGALLIQHVHNVYINK